MWRDQVQLAGTVFAFIFLLFPCVVVTIIPVGVDTVSSVQLFRIGSGVDFADGLCVTVKQCRRDVSAIGIKASSVAVARVVDVSVLFICGRWCGGEDRREGIRLGPRVSK